MTDRIVGKPIKEGNKNESEWPSKYGDRTGSGYYVFRYKDKAGKLHRTRQSPDDEYISINVDEAITEPMAPGLILDTMEPLESMATPNREIFDSKSAYKRHLKEHGYVITGGEHIKDANRRETQSEKEARHVRNLELTKEALMDVKYGRIEFSEQQKETFKREERAWGENYKLKVRS